MDAKKKLIELYRMDFLEALSAFEHSWKKVENQNPPSAEGGNLDAFEPWEAFTSRFARCTDIFLSKYVRLLILDLDPGFRGEMRDFLDKAEKAGFIERADAWMKIRELRNKIAHEYTKEDLVQTLKEVKGFSAFVLNELQKFKHQV